MLLVLSNKLYIKDVNSFPHVTIQRMLYGMLPKFRQIPFLFLASTSIAFREFTMWNVRDTEREGLQSHHLVGSVNITVINSECVYIYIQSLCEFYIHTLYTLLCIKVILFLWTSYRINTNLWYLTPSLAPVFPARLYMQLLSYSLLSTNVRCTRWTKHSNIHIKPWNVSVLNHCV